MEAVYTALKSLENKKMRWRHQINLLRYKKTPVRCNSENHKPSDSYSRSRKERPVDIYLKGEKKFPNRKKLYFLNLVLHLAYPSVK